jgi:ferric-dicitrate binding protein FerR (iron transport regulator)
MKEMNQTERFSDREWEELASLLSDEKGENSELLNRFMADDIHKTGEQWKNLRSMSNDKEINVDRAWNNLSSRLNENRPETGKSNFRKVALRTTLLRIAAVAIILFSLGSLAVYINNSGYLSKKISVVTGSDQKNLLVSLPDGSKVFLNRNSQFSYRENFGRNKRDVKLTGEAYFEIATDANNPFIIDAGKASIKVVGTSFNVITNNPESAVEVFVVTGKVILSDKSGSQSVALEPGYIGKMDSKKSEKLLNDNPNYRSWNTGLLVYSGQKLDVVFKDLKRVYNMDIVADDPSILENPWSSPIDDNETEETIIRIICTSFNLSYTKDGNVYHLSKK